MRMRLMIGAGVLVAALSGAMVVGAEPQEPATAAQYPAVKAEWDQISKRLDEIINRYQSATAEQQTSLRQEYAGLVAKMNALLPKLRAAGVAAYQAAPNQDAELMRLLVGLSANDVRNDRYEDALELAQMLIDKGCSEKAVYGFAGVAAYGLDQFEVAQTYLTTAKEADVLPEDGQVCLTDVVWAAKLWAKEQAARQQEAAAKDLPQVRLKTTKGDLLLELYENEAPQTVGNFVSLVEKGFYNGLSFHRVLPGFMAQGGCPTGDGSGGPGYEIFCECQMKNHRNHFRGTLSMAHAGRNTGGSQFFLTFRRTSHLDGQHTVFGRVIEGLDVLAKLQRRDPGAEGRLPEPDRIVEATVVRKRPHEYQPHKVQ